MKGSPSPLSRRAFLTTAGTVGTTIAIGQATSTTDSPSNEAPTPAWTIPQSESESRTYYPFTTTAGRLYAISSPAEPSSSDSPTVVHSLDLATGDEQWTLPNVSVRDLKVEDDAVYLIGKFGREVAKADFELVVLDAKSGRERWRHGLDDSLFGLVFGNGAVYAPHGSHVIAFDRDSGKQRWDTDMDANRTYGLAYADKTIIVNTGTGVRALSAVDGTERWGTAERGLDGVHFAVAAADRVYCQNQETLFAFDPEDGSEVWSVEIPDRSFARPLLHEGVLYRWGSTLLAIDASDGTIRWQSDAVEETSPYQPLIGDDAIFSKTEAGTVYAVTLDGSLRWSTDILTDDTFIYHWGAIRDGMAYVTGDDRLYALSAVDGSRQWIFETDEPITGVQATTNHIALATRGAMYGFERQHSLVATIFEETTDFLTSGIGLVLSGVLVGTGGVAAYRQLSERDDSNNSDPDVALESDTGSDPDVEYGRLERIGVDDITETYRVRKRTDEGPRVVYEKRLTDPTLAEEFRPAVERWAALSDRRGVVSVLEHGDAWVELPAYEDGSLVECTRPLTERLDALSAANMTVHRAHADGLVHGGLTPETILLDGETAHVSDWELATALADHREPTPFDAPEQRAGESVDERTDVYRLGAIGYFVATGHPPTDGRASDPASAVPRQVISVCTKAMAVYPDDRYQSVVEFDDMLRWAAFRA